MLLLEELTRRIPPGETTTSNNRQTLSAVSLYTEPQDLLSRSRCGTYLLSVRIRHYPKHWSLCCRCRTVTPTAHRRSSAELLYDLKEIRSGVGLLRGISLDYSTPTSKSGDHSIFRSACEILPPIHPAPCSASLHLGSIGSHTPPPPLPPHPQQTSDLWLLPAPPTRLGNRSDILCRCTQ